MKNHRLFLLLVILPFIIACAPTITKTTSKKANVEIGEQLTVSSGDPVVSEENITWVDKKEWVGVLNAPGGWAKSRYATDDSVKQELIYNGASGNIVEFKYREYRKDFSEPAYIKTLHFDLSESPILVFRNTELKVLKATDSELAYQVVRYGLGWQ